MGGFLGLGGSSAKTDRKAQLTGFGDLSNLFNFGLDNSKSATTTGTKTTATGTDALSTALNYFKKLASGDRTTQMAAIAPQANTALQQGDALRTQRGALGTARGGGTAGANQTAQDQTMAQIDNFLFGVTPMAAQEVGDLGGKLSQVGLGEENIGLGFADLSEKSAADLTKDASASRSTSYDINQNTVKNATGAIEQILAGIGF